MDAYEEKYKPSDYPLIEECLAEFYKARNVYMLSGLESDKNVAIREMQYTFFQAKGHMSMGYISTETFYSIKEHLEEGLR